MDGGSTEWRLLCGSLSDEGADGVLDDALPGVDRFVSITARGAVKDNKGCYDITAGIEKVAVLIYNDARVK